MIGHCDTVWPIRTIQKMPFTVRDNIVKGPGVYDMKAGLAQMIFALQALREFELVPELTPIIFINSDEEIGSRRSSSYVRMLARRVDRVLVLEPSLGQAGHLKTARKAVGRFAVIARGKAAHAGLDPEAGVSAILEMSHVIQKLFALNDAARGISVNVGKIDGGLRPNVIAPESKAIVDVRVRTQEDAARVENAILNLESTIPRVELFVEGGIGRAAMEPTPRNRALWSLAKELGRRLHLELTEATAGGASDGNTTSQFTATLDGLGPVGDGAHADHEFIYLDRTMERTALLALLLAAPSCAAGNISESHIMNDAAVTS